MLIETKIAVSIKLEITDDPYMVEWVKTLISFLEKEGINDESLINNIVNDKFQNKISLENAILKSQFLSSTAAKEKAKRIWLFIK